MCSLQPDMCILPDARAFSHYTIDMPDFDTLFHSVRIADVGGVRIMKFERNHQSSMHIDDPFETDIEYVGYLHIAVAVAPHATRALVVGLGGGSLVKRMWRDYPHMSIDAVELDPQVIDFAREYFALPDDPRITVYHDEGRRFIESCSATYDIIILDAFDDDHVPSKLLTEQFLRACQRILSPDGVLAYNVIGATCGAHSRPFRSLHRTLSNIWRHVWTFPLRANEGLPDATRNIIVLASDAELSDDQLLERIGSRVDGMVTVPAFERCAEDLHRSGIRSGDVPILSDPHRR